MAVGDGTAGVVLAEDASGNVAATAIAVTLPETSALPLVIDYRSTAFTRLMFTPGFTTTDPFTVVLVRGLAEQVPAFTEFAESLERRAATDPAYFRSSTEEEDRLLLAVRSGVLDALGALATQADAATRASSVSRSWRRTGYATGVSPGSSAVQTGIAPVTCADPKDARNLLLERLSTPGAAGVCAYVMREEDDNQDTPEDDDPTTTKIKFLNYGYVWAGAFTRSTADAARVAIPPTRFSLPGIADIARAAFDGVVASAVDAFKHGLMSMFGVEDEKADESLLFAPLLKAVEEVYVVEQRGESAAVFPTKELRKGVYTIGAGLAQDPKFSLPSNFHPELVNALAWTATLFTQAVYPTIELATGVRIEKRNLDTGTADEFSFPDFPPNLVEDAFERAGEITSDSTPPQIAGVFIEAIYDMVMDAEFSSWFYRNFYSNLLTAEVLNKLLAQLVLPIYLIERGIDALNLFFGLLYTGEDIWKLTSVAGWRLAPPTAWGGGCTPALCDALVQRAGNTVITVVAPTCNGCVITPITALISEDSNCPASPCSLYYQHATVTISRGEGELVMPKALTRGLVMLVETADQRHAGPGAGVAVVFQYADYSAGQDVTAEQALKQRFASHCWAGTTDSSLTLNLATAEWQVQPTTESSGDYPWDGRGITAWLSPQQASITGYGGMPFLETSDHGQMGFNDTPYCLGTPDATALEAAGR